MHSTSILKRFKKKGKNVKKILTLYPGFPPHLVAASDIISPHYRMLGKLKHNDIALPWARSQKLSCYIFHCFHCFCLAF